jgi:hypothetical protein
MQSVITLWRRCEYRATEPLGDRKFAALMVAERRDELGAERRCQRRYGGAHRRLI